MSLIKRAKSKIGKAALGGAKLGLAVARKSPIGTALAVGGLALGATKLFKGKKKGGGRKSKSVGYWKRKSALLRAKKEYSKLRGY